MTAPRPPDDQIPATVLFKQVTPEAVLTRANAIAATLGDCRDPVTMAALHYIAAILVKVIVMDVHAVTTMPEWLENMARHSANSWLEDLAAGRLPALRPKDLA